MLNHTKAGESRVIKHPGVEDHLGRDLSHELLSWTEDPAHVVRRERQWEYPGRVAFRPVSTVATWPPTPS
jgi:hypothetical protein